MVSACASHECASHTQSLFFQQVMNEVLFHEILFIEAKCSTDHSNVSVVIQKFVVSFYYQLFAVSIPLTSDQMSDVQASLWK
jgi:hypothetical protein